MKVTISPTPGDTLVIPEHTEGGEWLYSLGHGQGEFSFADRAADLIAIILPDYDALADDEDGDGEALWQRYRHVVQLAAQAQSGINASATAKGDLDPATCGEEVLTALMQDRELPWIGFDRPGGRSDLDWQFKVPLVLIATQYAPFTDASRPSGRIIWLDPSRETSYLESLAALGLVDFRVKQG